MGTGQINMPQFGAIPQAGIAAPDYQGAVANNYAGQMSAYNQQQANSQSGSNGVMGLIGSLAGAGATMYAASDRRLKTGISKIGEYMDGVNLYLFNYIWSDDPQIGVMADEVKKVIPEAVIRHESGYDFVDYGAIKNAS